MSHSLNRVLSTWEDVLIQLGRKSVSWQGNPLSERDQRTFTEAIVMAALHLTDISNRYGGVGSQREIIAWAHLCVSLDVSALGTFLSDVTTLLREVKGPVTYNWFKRQLAGEYPFTGRFLAPIRGALDAFLASPTPRGFYPCYQFLSFLTHLTLLDIDLDLEGGYEDLETYLRSLSYPEATLSAMNKIMIEWMEGFSLTEETFFPKHGPGATAETSALATYEDKYPYLNTDALSSYVFSKYAGVDLSTYSPRAFRGDASRQSKIVFVPKSMKTRRVISKEPTWLMYNQQGVSSALVQYMRTVPGLAPHINLEVQALNADMAITASGDQKFATIDLSSASDTVTNRLVKAVFQGTPVYPFLVALRSRTTVLPSGKVCELAKYAPMGSALCFPVETLIFACAVEYTVRRATRTHLGYFPKWRVYGDDIIVADPLFEDLAMTLESLGFILNRSKSYSSPYRFRESCGGEGYDGIKVTPMKISRRFRSVEGRYTSCHAAEFTGMVDMANDCYVYQFAVLRAWIIRRLIGNLVAPPLFSGIGHGALYSPWPDNYRAAHRVNFDLWRSEIQVAQLVLKRKKTSDDDSAEDDVRLYETLRITAKRSGDMFLPSHRVSVSRGPCVVRLTKRWVERPSSIGN